MAVVRVVNVWIDASLHVRVVNIRASLEDKRMRASKMFQKYFGSVGSPPIALQISISKNLEKKEK